MATIKKAIRYASGAVTPAYDAVNWTVNNTAVAGAVWVMPCMSTPESRRAPERSWVSVVITFGRVPPLSAELKRSIEPEFCNENPP